MINRKIFCKSGPKLTIASSSEWERSARFGDWYFTRQSSNELHSTMYWRTSVYYLGMWWSQVKPTSGGLGFCVSNPSDADLPHDHSLFCWTAIYRCLHILNTKLDDICRSHAAFNIIQTSRNSYSVCVCVHLFTSARHTTDGDEWWMRALCNKRCVQIRRKRVCKSARFRICPKLRDSDTAIYWFIQSRIRTPTRGRPRTAWIDNIKTWTGLSVEESVRMTEINGESASTVWPTLGSRTAKKQNRRTPTHRR